jgi:hypothetical protein
MFSIVVKKARVFLAKFYFPVMNYLITLTWILVSLITNKLTKSINPTLKNKNIDVIYFIVPDEKNYIIYKNTHARSIEILGAPYLRKQFNSKVIELNYKEIKNVKSSKTSVFVTYLAGVSYNPQFFLYLLKIAYLSLRIKLKRMTIMVLLGDTYYPDVAIIAQILTFRVGGCILGGPNTTKEMVRYGYSNAVSPVIFIEIIYKILEASTSQISFSDRQDTCLVASGPSATSIRRYYMDRLAESLVRTKYQISESDGSLSIENYIAKLGNVKFYATTNMVQEIYWIGPQFYQNRISKSTLTGRSYNGFAAGLVVITNTCDALIEMGFIRNIHYLDLDEIISNQRYVFPDESELSKIASNGRAQLVKTLDKGIDFNSPNNMKKNVE